jgi:hypothetical protein
MTITTTIFGWETHGLLAFFLGWAIFSIALWLLWCACAIVRELWVWRSAWSRTLTRLFPPRRQD